MSWIKFTSIVFTTVVALLVLVNVVAAQHRSAQAWRGNAVMTAQHDLR